MVTKFGIEIEFKGLGYSNEAYRRIGNDCQSAGIHIADESYNHYTRTYWKLVEDGSVSGGAEAVSPILLANDEGISQVATLLNILKDKGAYMDYSCGIHVHVDATWLNNFSYDIRREYFMFLAKTYAKHENVFDSFVKTHRRENRNTYCYSPNYLLSRGDWTVLNERFSKVNLFSAFERHGTIEFRHLHGTLNADAVSAWIRLVTKFAENCKIAFLQKYSESNPTARSLLADASLD